MKKFLILLASLFIQSVLGGVYAWSTLGKPLRDVYGLTSFQTELIYGLSIGFFALTMVFSGRLIKKTGPRPLALVSAGLYAGAFWLASQSGGSFPLLLTTLGIGMGLAIGFGYVTPLSTAVRWFPQHKGLVTGFAVFGFGGGSLLSANIVQGLLGSGMDILQVFSWLAAAGGGIIFLSALVMDFPKSEDADPLKRDQHLDHLVKDPVFWRLFLGMLAGTLGGLVIIGKASAIAAEFGHPEAAVLVVSALALGNSSGRLFWGGFNDSFPRITIPATLVLIGLSSILLLSAGPSLALFLVLSFLVGFGFGGSLVVYAAHTEADFGKGSISQVYPLIFLGYGFAAVIGPPLGGWLHDATGSYTPVLLVAGGVSLAGLFSMLIARKEEV